MERRGSALTSVMWSRVFDIDPTYALPGRTWWWWWFIFLFRNEADPQRSKQLVLLWGTRNCHALLINGHEWRNDGTFRRGDGHVDCPGMCAGWYYDGSTMHDPLFVDDGLLTADWDGAGRLVLDSGCRYAFDAISVPHRISINRPNLAIDLEIHPWNEYLSQIMQTGKRYLFRLGYQMQKIRGVRSSGTVRLGCHTDRVTGTAYFQKVRINSPTCPWYWGIFHSQEGSYVDYFLPHLGPPLLRRSSRHESPWDWGEWRLSSSFQFKEAATGELHSVHGVRVAKHYVENLPVFRLTGTHHAKSIEMEMTSYARATWVIRQPLIGPFANILHYNEYPANVTRFNFRDGRRRVRLDDIGPIIGNCEHSWGLV